MLHSAGFPKAMKEKLWAEAAKHPTEIENIICTANKNIPSYMSFSKTKFPIIKFMKCFGDIAVIGNNPQNKLQNKLGNRGRHGIYLGSVPNHNFDVLKFLNPETNSVFISRDITWLNKVIWTMEG